MSYPFVPQMSAKALATLRRRKCAGDAATSGRKTTTELNKRMATNDEFYFMPTDPRGEKIREI